MNAQLHRASVALTVPRVLLAITALSLLAGCGACPVSAEHTLGPRAFLGVIDGTAAVLVDGVERQVRTGHAEVCPNPNEWVSRSELLALSLGPDALGEVVARLPWTTGDADAIVPRGDVPVQTSFASEPTLGLVVSLVGDTELLAATPPAAPYPEPSDGQLTLVSTDAGPVYQRSFPLELALWTATDGVVWSHRPVQPIASLGCADGSAARSQLLATTPAATSPGGRFVISVVNEAYWCDRTGPLDRHSFAALVVEARSGAIVSELRAQDVPARTLAWAVGDEGHAAILRTDGATLLLAPGGETQELTIADEGAPVGVWAVPSGGFVRVSRAGPSTVGIALTREGDETARAELFSAPDGAERNGVELGADRHGLFAFWHGEQLCMTRYDEALTGTDACVVPAF